MDAADVARSIRWKPVGELGADRPAQGSPQPMLVGEEGRVVGRLLEQPSPRLVDRRVDGLDADVAGAARAAGSVEQMVDVVAREVGRRGLRSVDVIEKADIGGAISRVARFDPDTGVAVGIARA